MKKIGVNQSTAIIILVLLTISLQFWTSCKSCQEEKKQKLQTFSGRIVDGEGQPVPEATVSIDDSSAISGTDGSFQINLVPDTSVSAPRFVLSVSKQGYAFLSSILQNEISDGVWTLSKATVVPINPTQNVTVVDDSNDCPPSVLKNPPGRPLANVPFVYDATGKLIGFKMPAELKTSFDSVKNMTRCNKGFRVSIAGNSLIRRSNGSAPTGNLQVAVSTVNLFARDQMPGDNTAVSAFPQPQVDAGKQKSKSPGDSTQMSKEQPDSSEREPDLGYMVSFGAGSIEVFDGDGEIYDLREGSSAEILIPIDPLVLQLNGNNIPDQMPFLTYDRKSGTWFHESMATLNAERTAYVANTTHFSEFNMDLFKTDPSCVKFRFDASIIGYPSYPIKIIGPVSSFTSRDIVVSEPTGPLDFCSNVGDKDLHVLYNLPNNVPIAMVFLDPTTSAPLITNVLYTGPPANPTDLGAMNVPICPYTSCTGEILFQDFGSTANPILADYEEPGTDGIVNLSWAFIFTTPGDPGNVYALNERQNSTDPWTLVSGTIPGDTVGTFVLDKDPGQFFQFQVTAIDGVTNKLSNIVDVNVPF